MAMSGKGLMSKIANSMKYKNLIGNSCISFTKLMFCGDRMLTGSCKEMFLMVSLLIYLFKEDYLKEICFHGFQRKEGSGQRNKIGCLLSTLYWELS